MDTGNTLAVTSTLIAVAVHPRGYGEHYSNRRKSATDGGSSPWIRGTLIFSGFFSGKIRFIPVDTGNTFLLTKNLGVRRFIPVDTGNTS